MAYSAIGLLPILLVQIAVSVLLILGGRAMMTGRSYGLAMTAGVLALIPTGPVWLLSLPMGIWALWTLTRPDVKAAFGRPSASTGSGRGVFIVLALLGGVAVVVVGIGLVSMVSWTSVREEATVVRPSPVGSSPERDAGVMTPRVPSRVISSRILGGQYEHESAVVALAFHPTGDALASVDADGRALFWNPETGEQIQRMDNVGAVAYSPDGRRLAVGDRDGESVELFDASNHKTMLQQFSGEPARPFNQLAFNPDGSRLAALSSDGKTPLVQVWETKSDGLRTQLPHDNLVSCAFRDIRNLVLVYGDGDAVIWDSADQNAKPQSLSRFPGNLVEGGYSVTAVAFSESTTRFFAGLDLGKIYSRREHGPGTAVWQAHPTAVRALTYKSGEPLVSGGDDGIIRLWKYEYRSGYREQNELEGHQGPVTALAWSPDGRVLASGGADRTVKLWRLR